MISQFIALVGERITTIAFISIASKLSPRDAGMSTSLIGAFQISPIILFSFTGGYLADKFQRRNLLLKFNSIETVNNIVPAIQSISPLAFKYFNKHKLQIIPASIHKEASR